MRKHRVVAAEQTVEHFVLKQVVEHGLVLLVVVEGGWDGREWRASVRVLEHMNKIAGYHLPLQV